MPCLFHIVNEKNMKVLQSSFRLIKQQSKNKILKFLIKGPEHTPAVARVFLAGKNKIKVSAQNAKGDKINVNVKVEGATALIKFPNSPDGITVKVF